MNTAAFLSYAVLTIFTPGPNTIMAMTSAGKFGFKRSLRFCLGVTLGFAIILSLAALFSGLLYRLLPDIELVMKALGSAYILWLAWLVWRDKPRAENEGEPRTIGILSGAALQFVNVKAIIFGLTVFSGFILPHYHAPMALAAFVLLLSAFVLTSNFCWAYLGATLQRVFGKYRKSLNLVMALLLVYSAVSLYL